MRRLALSSVRLRLLLAGAVSILVALALAGAGLALLFQRHVERRAVAELSAHLDQVIAGLDRSADGVLVQTRAPADPRFAHPLSGLYWQVEAEGSVLRSRSLWDAELDLPDDTLGDGSVHEHVMPGPAGEQVLILERRVTLPARLGGKAVVVAVALDRAELRAATAAFAVDLLPFLGVLAAVLIAASWAQITVGLRPLRAIRARVKAVLSGQATRLGDAFPDEVRPLAAAVDDLLAAREADVERARARAADLAHGLKTPLQVLEGDIARLRAQGDTALADGIAQVAGAMHRHVDHELARARLAARLVEATCRPVAVAARVIAVVRRSPAGDRLVWEQDIPEDLRARIDADDLTEVLGSLVENAARHAGSRVRLAGWRDGAAVVLSVDDDGPGIPAARRQTVLGRGGRLDTQAQGTGLGLAIAGDILAAWQGALVLTDATWAEGGEADGGGGLSARIVLPAGRPGPDPEHARDGR